MAGIVKKSKRMKMIFMVMVVLYEDTASLLSIHLLVFQPSRPAVRNHEELGQAPATACPNLMNIKEGGNCRFFCY